MSPVRRTPDEPEKSATTQPPWHGGPWERRCGGKKTPGLPFAPEELGELEAVAQNDGWVWTFEHACLCLEQARAFGVLPQVGSGPWPEGFLCGTRRRTN